MSTIERTISVSFRHQVFFTEDLFATANATLKDTLLNAEEREPRKTFVVVDESLAKARPGFIAEIESYFAAHSDSLKLVAPPMVLEGGERVKNSYFHVSEIHSQLERHGVCRHSYMIAIGGG
ncbi:MAG: 3-dehydroquinate synthase, partial [Candidatus Binatia bacterium]